MPTWVDLNSIRSAAIDLLALFASLPPLTQWAVAILLAFGFVIHVLAYNERTAHDAPSIFTTGGIFFTFVGIAKGLLSFDPQKIEGSVPQLLEGLQTAFIASVVGVFIALSIKMRVAVFGPPNTKGDRASEGATIDDLVDQMAAVQSSLVGQEESTLLSQMKLTRTDINDRLDRLHKSQSDFMQRMAQDNSKALIQALQEVIRDFNVKISEQFGENFKRLNEAVGSLLVWQQQYRQHISDLIDQQTSTANNMKIAANHFGQIVAQTDSFANAAENLSSLIEALNEQRGHIEESLTALGDLLTEAKDGIPVLENKIVALTEQMTFGVKAHQDGLTNAIRASSKELQAAADEVKKLMVSGIQSANQEINAHVKQISEKTSDQIVKLDQALERELTKALTTLGSQLTTLSKHFVDDYKPLTDRLRELTRMAGEV